MDDQGSRTLASVQELEQHYAKTPADDRDPFWQALLKGAGETVCLIQTHFWANVGGPGPYSDSYTMVVYTHGNESDRLSKACTEACSKMGADVGATIAGLPRPQVSAWAKMKRWFA
jgi:hypothetical protein